MVFSPEFHWQIIKKQKIRKRVLVIFLGLILLLSILFIFKKYYFVSGRSIGLDQLVSNNIKAVLRISVPKVLDKRRDSLSLRRQFISALQYYFNDDTEKTDLLINNIGKTIYWMEKTNDSQVLLFKINNIEIIKEIFNSIALKLEDVRFNGKTIYELNVNWPNNQIMPLKDDKLYVSYLNNYIACVGNDIEFIQDIINKYKEALRIDYFKSLKDEFGRYFQEQADLKLEVNDYNDIKSSSSWLKILSFINQDTDKNSFIAELNIESNKIELLLNNLDSVNQRIDINKLDSDWFNNFTVYYSNLNIKYEDRFLDLGKNIDYYLKTNIESLYNLNFKDELLNIGLPFYFIMYPKDNFLIISRDSERLMLIYKHILSHFKPKTRIMTLPDKTQAIEYYIDPEIIELKTRQDDNIVWYYDDLPGNINFYLVEYNDWYILSNFKEKIIELSQNYEKFCELLSCSDKQVISELLMLNLNNFDKTEYLPWITMFSDYYNKLIFANFSRNNDINMVFQLIH